MSSLDRFQGGTWVVVSDKSADARTSIIKRLGT